MILPDGYSDILAGKIAAIVTHLEMRAPPVLSPDPPSAWAVRQVKQPGLDWYRDLYTRVGAEWLWASRLRMSDAELTAIIRAGGVEVHALQHKDGDEGLLELDFRTDGECEIVFFGVTATLIGSGAGRVLMNHALRLAWGNPVSRVWLHTCSFDHPRALAFYRRSGFRPFRQQVEVIDDPRLDETLPRHVAPHVPLID
jgi:GNAT superfamily N-acetyltransferase